MGVNGLRHRHRAQIVEPGLVLEGRAAEAVLGWSTEQPVVYGWHFDVCECGEPVSWVLSDSDVCGWTIEELRERAKGPPE